MRGEELSGPPDTVGATGRQDGQIGDVALVVSDHVTLDVDRSVGQGPHHSWSLARAHSEAIESADKCT